MRRRVQSDDLTASSGQHVEFGHRQHRRSRFEQSPAKCTDLNPEEGCSNRPRAVSLTHDNQRFTPKEVDRAVDEAAARVGPNVDSRSCAER